MANFGEIATVGAAARADCDFGTLDLLLRISGCGVFPVCVEGAKLGLRAVLWEARPLLLQFMFKPCQGSFAGGLDPLHRAKAPSTALIA